MRKPHIIPEVMWGLVFPNYTIPSDNRELQYIGFEYLQHPHIMWGEGIFKEAAETIQVPTRKRIV